MFTIIYSVYYIGLSVIHYGTHSAIEARSMVAALDLFFLVCVTVKHQFFGFVVHFSFF